MDNKNKKIGDEVMKKNKQTLSKEKQDLQNRQEILRVRKEALLDERKSLRRDLYAAKKSKKEDDIELIQMQLDDIETDIKDINFEYKMNSECLDCYEKVSKSKSEGRGSALSTVFGGIATAATIALGAESLRKAYKSDEEGTLVNKKTLDVFNRINPLRILDKFPKKK